MRRTATTIVLLLLAAACGGGPSSPSGSGGASGSSGGSGGSAGSGGRGTLTALVDGVSYTGVVNAASLTNGTLNIASNNSARTLSVNFAVSNAAVGTVTLGPSTPMTMQVMTTDGTAVTGVWVATLLAGTGTLTINSLTSSGVSGTFSFVAPPSTSPGVNTPPGNKTVANGVFSATF